MDEEAEWQSPKRRKTVTPKRLVSPETGDNVESDNLFSPLAARATQIRDQEKSMVGYEMQSLGHLSSLR